VSTAVAPLPAAGAQGSASLLDATLAWSGAEKYLKALTDLAHNALSSAAIKEDFEAVTRCFGATPDAGLFARSYERYLADGEAVGDDLQRVFRHYSWWLNLKRGGR
jgi:hypothetical protein